MPALRLDARVGQKRDLTNPPPSRPAFLVRQMRYAMGYTLMFYVTGSALQIAKESSLSDAAYMGCVSALYFCIYVRIVVLAYKNVREQEQSVTLLEQHSVPQGFLKVREAKGVDRPCVLLVSTVRKTNDSH